ncbi:MAG: phosphatidylglycerophosphatase A [Verrucomicrobia bacterium]|nr:phosphatidylglycerophosphatase A [Verrucomicrobiota bacterium]
MKPLVLLANGFGLGLSPVASGTVGSIPGLLIVLALSPVPLAGQIAIAVCLAMLAIPICSAGERHYGQKDDGRIVADEYLTFPLCTLGLPVIANPWLLVFAFCSNRALDIVKPPPAQQAQSLKGGVGIVLDDVASSLYALAANHLAWFLYQRWLAGAAS